jgi:hypothetical protein
MPDSSESFQLRLLDLIVAAKSAIRRDRLGIQHDHIEPRIVYNDGSACLFAAAFPRRLLQRIAADEERANWLRLKTAGYFDLDSLATVEALTTFQLAYDVCRVEDVGVKSRRTERLFNFTLSLNPHDPPEVWPSQVIGSDLFS